MLPTEQRFSISELSGSHARPNEGMVVNALKKEQLHHGKDVQGILFYSIKTVIKWKQIIRNINVFFEKL